MRRSGTTQTFWEALFQKKDKDDVEVYTGNGSVEKVKAKGPGIQLQLHGKPETSLGYSGLCQKKKEKKIQIFHQK